MSRLYISPSNDLTRAERKSIKRRESQGKRSRNKQQKKEEKHKRGREF